MSPNAIAALIVLGSCALGSIPYFILRGIGEPKVLTDEERMADFLWMRRRLVDLEEDRSVLNAMKRAACAPDPTMDRHRAFPDD